MIAEDNGLSHYVARDTSEQAYERVQRNVSAIEAAKMESTAKLASVILHDFNNLLTGISGFAGLASKRVAGDDPAACNFAKIDILVRQASSLLDSFWKMTDPHSRGITPLNLNILISGLADSISLLIGDGWELEILAEPEILLVGADRSDIEQAVLSLIAHAREITPEGGKMTLITANAPSVPEKMESGLKTGQALGRRVMLALSVAREKNCKDKALTGQSCSNKDPEGDRGLALAALTETAEQYDGQFEIERNDAQETIFRIYFPVFDPPPRRPEVGWQAT